MDFRLVIFFIYFGLNGIIAANLNRINDSKVQLSNVDAIDEQSSQLHKDNKVAKTILPAGHHPKTINKRSSSNVSVSTHASERGASAAAGAATAVHIDGCSDPFGFVSTSTSTSMSHPGGSSASSQSNDNSQTLKKVGCKW